MMRSKNTPLEYICSCYVESKHRAIKPFKPINRGSNAHDWGVKLKFTPQSWVLEPRYIGLNGRIARCFDSI